MRRPKDKLDLALARAKATKDVLDALERVSRIPPILIIQPKPWYRRLLMWLDAVIERRHQRYL